MSHYKRARKQTEDAEAEVEMLRHELFHAERHLRASREWLREERTKLWEGVQDNPRRKAIVQRLT